MNFNGNSIFFCFLDFYFPAIFLVVGYSIFEVNAYF